MVASTWRRIFVPVAPGPAVCTAMHLSTTQTPFATALRGAIALCFSLTTAIAQCGAEWRSLNGIAGVDGAVYCSTEWDPDGAGPRSPVIVFGGAFDAVGSQIAANIAAYDPVSGAWSTFGAGMSDYVGALQVTATGTLVAGGGFHSAGEQVVHGIAFWDGAHWMPLGTRFTNGVLPVMVRDFALLPNGDLVAGGHFESAGGVPAANVAAWNGTSWRALGSGMNDLVNSLALAPNGDLLAGGRFTTAGSTPASRVARWNGLTWQPLGPGIPGSFGNVNQLLVRPSGNVVAGGYFLPAGTLTAPHVAEWDGTTWNSLGAGLAREVYALANLPSGEIVAGGRLSGFSKWDGASWLPLGLLNGTVYHILPQSSAAVYIGGNFQAVGVDFRGIGLWDGVAIRALAQGSPAYVSVRALTALPGGAFVAGGSFTHLGSVTTAHVALWDGRNWRSMGSGLNSSAGVLLTRRTGQVVAGGAFTLAGGVRAEGVAQWDGRVWAALGAGLQCPSAPHVVALAELPSGDLVAGGAITGSGSTPLANVARWDGSQWRDLGGGMNGTVFTLLVAPDGSLVAAGEFTIAGATPVANVARWNGTAWVPVGAGLSGGPVNGLRLHPDGSLIAFGDFSRSGRVGLSRVARFDGNGWVPLGAGLDFAPPSGGVLSNGDLIMNRGAVFPIGMSMRWDGQTWTPVPGTPTHGVHALLFQPDSGELVFGGDFARAGGWVEAGGWVSFGWQVAIGLAVRSTTCPAQALTYGVGCTGSGGSNQLSASALPWVGSQLSLRARGLASRGAAVALVGVRPLSVPLASLSSFGGVGCSLLANPDVIVPLVLSGGAASFQLPIPNNARLAGAVLYEQVLALETDAQGGIVVLTSTNGVGLRIGTM